MKYLKIPTLASWKADAYQAVLRTDPEIVQLLSDFQTYEQAFSPMAKRNMLRALLKDLGGWKGAWGRESVAWGALRDVVERQITYDEGAIARRYDQVVCIGYKFNVGKFDRNNKVAYTGKLDDQADMEDRAAKMISAIYSAYNALHRDLHHQRFLKIFMGPEFFFRGRYGAYPHDIVSQIIPRMRKGATGGAIFKDWLFVFGTAIAAAIDERMWCFTCGNAHNVVFAKLPIGKTRATCKLGPNHDVRIGVFGATIDNVALIQKGPEDYLVFKEYVSPIDFRDYRVQLPGSSGGPRKRIPVLPPEGARPRDPLMQDPSVPSSSGSYVSSKHLDERMGGCIFSFDGITFGLEICLDHVESGGRLAAAQPIDILLIPSAGMDIQHYRTVDNGISFNVDGLRPGQGGAASQVMRKTGAVALEPGTPHRAGAGAGGIEIYGPFDLP
jgi:hypothetical protein